MRYDLLVTVAGRWFSQGSPVSSINKIDRHDITEILLDMSLNIIALTLDSFSLLKSQVSRVHLNSIKVVFKLTYLHINCIFI